MLQLADELQQARNIMSIAHFRCCYYERRIIWKKAEQLTKNHCLNFEFPQFTKKLGPHKQSLSSVLSFSMLPPHPNPAKHDALRMYYPPPQYLKSPC